MANEDGDGGMGDVRTKKRSDGVEEAAERGGGGGGGGGGWDMEDNVVIDAVVRYLGRYYDQISLVVNGLTAADSVHTGGWGLREGGLR